MKCIGNKCTSYIEKVGYNWCKEIEIRIKIDEKCELLKKISETRDDLLRRCALFEEILVTNTGESLEE